jgi:hypothetical protein
LASVALSARCFPTKLACGFTHDRGGVYQKKIPIEHLRHMQSLSDAFPDLSFFASELDVDPDPFIMCTTFQGWRIVFGVWDEPGFGAL